MSFRPYFYRISLIGYIALWTEVLNFMLQKQANSIKRLGGNATSLLNHPNIVVLQQQDRCTRVTLTDYAAEKTSIRRNEWGDRQR